MPLFMQPNLLCNFWFLPKKKKTIYIKNKLSNVLSNAFSIDIDYVSIAIQIVIVLSPSPILDDDDAGCIILQQHRFIANEAYMTSA